jgi:site-specific DNA-cytosine methylase
MSNIKWAAIQPLTGGMYLGAEEAIGHPAEFILSYPHLADENNNEFNLLQYLKKHNRCPRYYTFNRGMFDSDDNLLAEINPEMPEYANLDLVVAVPVCSGLSMSTKASDITKQSRNNNMLFITKYVLQVIHPKIYVFENAPTLFGQRGKELITEFNNLAIDNSYSVIYYKTDTRLHDNCQLRPRTFVIFIQHTGDTHCERPCEFEYYNNAMTPEQFFKSLQNDIQHSTQTEPINTYAQNYVILDFMQKTFGSAWYDKLPTCNIIEYCIKNNLYDSLLEFAKTYENEDIRERAYNHIKYIGDTLHAGKNPYSNSCSVRKNYMKAVQFRAIPNMINPITHKTCSIRDLLCMMGMPIDFEFYGNDLAKIGQNVPVKTAKFIVEQAIRSYENSTKSTQCDTTVNVIYQDNIKQKTFETLF